jgi:mannitol/fructose-specific phosphotransferase system IIA component (Ntr-type)
VSHWKRFAPKACSIALAGSTKADTLREIVSAMVAGGALDEGLVEPAMAALLERERTASTGVGSNVAIPHVKVPGLSETTASLCLHRAGVEWNAVDGEAVHVVFTVLRSERSDAQQHLELMKWIAKLARSGDFRSFATQSKTKAELVALLREMSAA